MVDAKEEKWLKALIKSDETSAVATSHFKRDTCAGNEMEKT